MSSVSLDRRSLLAAAFGIPLALWSSSALAQDNITEEDPQRLSDPSPIDGNIQLQAIGGLGVGHIQSTLGLIGVIADTVSKDIYTQKQIDDLMNGTVNGLESPKRMLRRLQDSDISGDDSEFLDRMISVFNALQREARALVVFSKSRKPDDAASFEKSRKTVLKKLSDLTHQDNLLQSDNASRRTFNSLPEKLANPGN